MIDPFRKKDEDFHKSNHLPMVSQRDRQFGNEYLDCIPHDDDGGEYGDSDDLDENYSDYPLDSEGRFRSDSTTYKLHPTGKQR